MVDQREQLLAEDLDQHGIVKAEGEESHGTRGAIKQANSDTLF